MKLILFIVLTFITSLYSFGQNESRTFLYVGSYTSGELAEGIYVYEFHTETGKLEEIQRIDSLINPSFLTISPNGQYLYSCTESRLDRYGSVSAFKIDTLTGKITFLNKQSTGGKNPVHVTVDATNTYVIVSNYTDAGISVFECNSDGSLKPFSQLTEFTGSSLINGRQNQAHMHSCNFSPDQHYIFAPDLGADKIRVFEFDQRHLLTTIDSLTIDTYKGAGPRHFKFHPNGSFAYCVEELSGTVSLYSYKNGQLNLIKTYNSYLNTHEEYAGADLHISPDGKFLYVSNRQDEHSISIYAIHSKNGQLSLKDHQSTYGTIPRSFVIDPSGQFLIVANQTSNKMVIFRRNFNTGLLDKASTTTGVNSPSSLKMIKY